MRCSSHGCECLYCAACGKVYESCICELRNETEDFLNELEYEDETRARQAERLLKKWLNNA